MILSPFSKLLIRSIANSSSAKRFPGVIPTTDLTRLFAKQNVRLPTRQKRIRGDSPIEVESGDGEDEDE